MDLERTIKVSDLISLYAAVVATAALFWNATLAVINLRAKIKVENSFLLSYPVSAMGDVGQETPSIAVTICNVGRNIRYITEPKLAISGFLKKKIYFQVLNLEESTRNMKLEPGEEYKKQVFIESLGRNVLRDYPYYSKFFFIVKDTHGKRYKSSKQEISLLREYYDRYYQ